MKMKSKSKAKNRGSEIDDVDESSVARKNRMLRKRIQGDARIARLLLRVEKIQLPQSIQDELTLMFVTTKNMKTGDYSYMGVEAGFNNPIKNMKKLANVFLTIQAYTDRVLTLQFQLEGIANTLAGYKRKCVEYIHESYSDVLKTKGPLTSQQVFIDTIIEPIIEKRELADMLVARCDKIVKNLSATHFAFSKLEGFGKSLIQNSEGGRNLRHD